MGYSLRIGQYSPILGELGVLNPRQRVGVRFIAGSFAQRVGGALPRAATAIFGYPVYPVHRCC
jgi:hypothetical protein